MLACWQACGFPDPDPEAVRRIIGLPWEESIRFLLPDAGDREFALIRAYYDDVARGVRQRPGTAETLFPGVNDTLDFLEAQGFVLGAGDQPKFAAAVPYAGEAGPGKTVRDRQDAGPRPRQAGAGPSAPGHGRGRAPTRAWTVMVGDTTFDILMARNAGTASVGVSWGVHHPDELIDAGAGRVVDAVHEIPDAIDFVTRDKG